MEGRSLGTPEAHPASRLDSVTKGDTVTVSTHVRNAIGISVNKGKL